MLNNSSFDFLNQDISSSESSADTDEILINRRSAIYKVKPVNLVNQLSNKPRKYSLSKNIFKMNTIVEKEEDSEDKADISIEDVGLIDLVMRSQISELEKNEAKISERSKMKF